MRHSVETLASEFDVTLVGPKGCGEFSPANVQTIECPPSPFSFLTTALLKGWQATRKTPFDIVLGGSGLVSPVTCLLAGRAKARSVALVHGLDLVVDNWIYHHLFVPFLRRHDRIIANSRNTRNKVVLSVGRMVRRKGLAEFLENAWPLIIETQPNAILLVVGDTPDDALLQDARGAQRLMNAIERCGEDTVRFLGAVDDDTLWNCYAAADTLVFPLIRVKGDVEGFGMVAIEAAASGTPTVAFPVGGVVDAVSDRASGLLVPEGDYQAFAEAVLSIFKGGPPSRSACRDYALEFSWDKHGQKLLSALGSGDSDVQQ